MFQRLPSYPDVSPTSFWDSGVPSHWSVAPGLAVMEENRRKNADLAEDRVLSLSYGRVVVKPVEKQRGLVPESYEGYQVLDPGDIVIRPTDLQNDQTSIRVGMVRDRGIITSAYIGLRPKGSWSSDYAYAYLVTVDSTKRIYGMGSGLRQQLGWDDLKRMPCLVPPPEEQAAIVKYLTHANARIDKAIAAKRRLISLLDEHLMAGLDDLLQLDRSDVEVSSIAQTAAMIQTGPFGSQLHAEEYTEGGVPVINPSHLTGSGIVPDRAVAVSAAKADELKRHRLEPGDVIAARRGDLGRCDVVTVREVGWLCGTGSLIIRLRTDKWIPEYFQMLFASPRNKERLQLGSVGSTMSNLNGAQVGRMRLARPDLRVQEKLVQQAQLLHETHRRQVSVVRREIDLIAEFRERLVADVVTGQVDVRGVAVGLPEFDVVGQADPAASGDLEVGDLMATSEV